MASETPPRPTSVCVSHRCPVCGDTNHVTEERVTMGARTVIQCLCRACGASWPAQSD